MFKRRLNALLPATLLAGSLVTGAAWAQGPQLEHGHEYMVVTNYPNAIHVIDLKSDRLYKSCKLPDSYGPGVTQMSPDGKTAYILNNHYEDIYGIDLDTCNVRFHAALSKDPAVRTKSVFSLAVSQDGKELYTILDSTELHTDHYFVRPTRLAVYNTNAGLDASPARTFPVPRQITVMEAGDDGTLYMAGADIYKMNVKTGKIGVAIPSRNWQRPLYAPPDVLTAWPIQSVNKQFTTLYTTARFKDKSMNPNTADWLYGFMNIDLKTGKTETVDFGPITEIYFTGMLSPKDPNQLFAVLNHLAKYDVKQQKMIASADLDHSYYCIAMNHAGTKVYLAGTMNDVAVYDADTLKKLGNIQIPGGDMAITTAQVFTR